MLPLSDGIPARTFPFVNAARVVAGPGVLGRAPGEPAAVRAAQ
jgi:hypothetical protein